MREKDVTDAVVALAAVAGAAAITLAFGSIGAGAVAFGVAVVGAVARAGRIAGAISVAATIPVAFGLAFGLGAPVQAPLPGLSVPLPPFRSAFCCWLRLRSNTRRKANFCCFLYPQ